MTEKQHRPVPFFRNNPRGALSPALSTIAILVLCIFPLSAADLRLNEQDSFEAQGLSVLLFHNAYHGVFGDEKMSGVEIILHGERIATNGAVPLMDPEFKEALASSLRSYKSKLDEQLSHNPYGGPIATGTWGGAAAAAGFSVQMYFFHKTFPDIVGPEYILRGFDYVLGTHPVSNLSFVSSVGTQSKLIAYGNNRADYTFIPGGIIPGVIIIQPDFPELKEAWPFLWYENEYVVDTVASYILAANAANAVAK